MQKNKPTLYKIYYGDTLVYLGRTNQPLQTRLRGHFFKKPMHRLLDLTLVSKVEYAEFQSIADMYLYEIYYINRLKPSLNVDDRARDELSVTLPDVEFVRYDFPLQEKWKCEIAKQNDEFKVLRDEYVEIPQRISVLRRQKRDGEITEDEYWAEKDKLSSREKELRKALYDR